MLHPERAVSTSAYGLSPGLILFLSESAARQAVSQKKCGTFIAYVAYTQQKACWKAEAFLFILQGAAAGRRGAPVSADSASLVQQAKCTVDALHPGLAEPCLP